MPRSFSKNVWIIESGTVEKERLLKIIEGENWGHQELKEHIAKHTSSELSNARARRYQIQLKQ